MKKLTGLCCMLMFGMSLAATPPGTVNYQGVLRDAAGTPLDGDHDMVFRFFTAGIGGDEILIDEHLAAGTGAVSVAGGLFNVGLGSGTIVDGSGPGINTGFSRIFRDHASVWMGIQVGTETLSPRVEVHSAPFALNAAAVGGILPQTLLTNSATPETKAGDLQVDGTLIAGGGNLVMTGGVAMEVQGPLTTLAVEVGSDNDDPEMTLDAFGRLKVKSGIHLSGSAEQIYWNGSNGFTMTDELRIPTSLSMGPSGAHSLAWDDINYRFGLSDNLKIQGYVDVTELRFNGATGNTMFSDGSRVFLDGDLLLDGIMSAEEISIHPDGPDAMQTIYFYDEGFATGEHLRWHDFDDNFTLSDSLVVFDTLNVGTSFAIAKSYNHFGSGSPNSGDMTLPGDIYVNGDLEVNETLYADGIRINPGGPDKSQSIYFYENGSQTGAYLRWDNTINNFVLSNVLHGPIDNNFWLESDGSLRMMIDDDSTTTGGVAEWFHNGSYTGSNKLGELQEDGDLRIRGTLSQNQVFDLAESFWASEPLQPGDLVAADPDIPGAVRKVTSATAGSVLGVVSAKPGVLLGSAPFDAGGLKNAWGEKIHDRFMAERPRLEEEVLQDRPELASVRSILALREVPAPVDVSAGNAATISTEATNPGMTGASADSSSPMVSSDAVSVPGSEAAWMEHESTVETALLDRFFEDHVVAVALAGRVPVMVDASSGPIAVGDALAPSEIPGVARKADGRTVAIAIALEPLASGQGMVLGFMTRFETSGGGLEKLETVVNERTPDPDTGVQAVPGNLQVVLDQGADEQAQFSIHRDGAATGQAGDEVFRVDEAGNVFARGAFRPHAMDLAEFFPVSEPVMAGHVIAIDPHEPEYCRLAATASDPAVVGVVSTEPGLLLGGSVQRIVGADAQLAGELQQAWEAGDKDRHDEIWNLLTASFLENHAAVALSGTAPVKVDAGYGDIRPGDLLVSSPTPGHAMRGDDPAPGTVIGKALSGLDTGTGTIRVLIFMR